MFSASTTYTTTTEISPAIQSGCIGCPKNDTIILPKYIDLPISYIKSGKWEDCLELCRLFHDLYWSGYGYDPLEDDCNYFNFYSSEFDGDLKNYCVIFSRILDEDYILDIEEIPMKGVISGALEPVPFAPGR